MEGPDLHISLLPKAEEYLDDLSEMSNSKGIVLLR